MATLPVPLPEADPGREALQLAPLHPTKKKLSNSMYVTSSLAARV